MGSSFSEAEYNHMYWLTVNLATMTPSPIHKFSLMMSFTSRKIQSYQCSVMPKLDVIFNQHYIYN